VLDILDRGWHLASRWQAAGDDADELVMLLQHGERMLAAAGVFLAGTTLTISYVDGTAVAVVLSGTQAADMALATEASTATVQELADTLKDIRSLTDQASLATGLGPGAPSMAAVMYHDLGDWCSMGTLRQTARSITASCVVRHARYE
jgi:hypothetical protein